jgi:predicted ATPase
LHGTMRSLRNAAQQEIIFFDPQAPATFGSLAFLFYRSEKP